MAADIIDSSAVSSPTLIISSADERNRILVQKCKLLAVSGPLKGQEFVVTSETFTIGSGRWRNRRPSIL
jgi:hypothetical protein